MSLTFVLGRAPRGERLERIKRSPNYRDGAFQNLEPTEVSLKDVSMIKVMREFMRRPATVRPGRPVPVVRTDLGALPAEGVSIVWFGHSSYLLKVNGTTILVDPVFSRNAAPVRWMAKAFPGTGIYDVDKMPDKIDIVLLTHDHFDHLDCRAIVKLKPRVGMFCASLGVGEHLEYWGVEREKIVELDWWESYRLGPDGAIVDGDVEGDGVDGSVGRNGVFTFTATPARHFSGRSFKRNNTLWSSFVLKVAGYTLFLGGDSGYGEHFKAIGERFGPFDLAILECGQYGKYWPHIHMFPEQTVEAARDLRAKKLMPVHWAKFTLSMHPWNEPIRRVMAAAMRAGQHITTPEIGQPVVLGHHYPSSDWWDFE